MRPNRALVGCMLLLLTGGSSRAREPLGRIVWTERQDSAFTVQTKLLVPPGTDAGLYLQGPVKVDSTYYVITDRRRADTLPTAKLLQDATGSVTLDSPRSKVRYLHPAFDVTGRRLLFTGGDTWGPNLSATQAEAVAGGTSLYFGVHDGPRRFTAPQAGLEMDAFPASDARGEWIYFSRFHYRGVSGQPPGWYLMRVPRVAAQAGTPGQEELLIADGSPVAGFQPTVTARGTHMLFVRQDPENLGSDLWVVPLEPSPSTPYPLMDGEGPGFSMPAPGGDRAAWAEYSAHQGKARIDHPSVASDGRYVAYACDRDGDWDIYTLPLQVEATGDLSAGTEERLWAASDQDTTHEMWPSVSGDGGYVAYMGNRSGTTADRTAAALSGGQTRIWMAGAGAGDGPVGYDQLLLDPGAGIDQMWPHWEQDEDPPHLLLVLQQSNGGRPTRLQLIDEEPDSSPRTDTVSLSLELADYYPEAPPPGSDIMPLFPPYEFGFAHPAPAIRIEYQTEDVASASDDDKGVNPFDTSSEVRRGHSLHLLLSGKRDRLGLHRGLQSFTSVQATGSGPGSPASLPDAAFDGIYLFENERLVIDVYARDNRWLRVAPEDAQQAALYSTDPVVEGTQIVVTDPRSLTGGTARPPYLAPRPPRDLMVQAYPGVAWWIEEGGPGETDESNFKVLYENPPYVIFRFANYPQEEVKPSQWRDLYLRVVARDLLSNVTDVRIPLHVRSKEFVASRLGAGTQRGR